MRDLKVAICDDETVDLAHVQQMLQQYDKSQRLQVTAFLHAADLLTHASSDGFDIVLLDIEMEAPNGYDIAKELKKRAKSPVIIFVTKSSEYTLRGYGIALRYLQKPLSPELFEEAMDAAIMEACAHRVTFVTEESTVALRLQEIQYIEMFGHYAVFHTDSKEYRLRSTLKDIAESMPKGYFAMPHKSILVNFEHIRSASANELLLDNGAKIPISRRRQQEFNQAFYRFLGR